MVSCYDSFVSKCACKYAHRCDSVLHAAQRPARQMLLGSALEQGDTVTWMWCLSKLATHISSSEPKRTFAFYATAGAAHRASMASTIVSFPGRQFQHNLSRLPACLQPGGRAVCTYMSPPGSRKLAHKGTAVLHQSLCTSVLSRSC